MNNLKPQHKELIPKLVAATLQGGVAARGIFFIANETDESFTVELRCIDSNFTMHFLHLPGNTVVQNPVVHAPLQDDRAVEVILKEELNGQTHSFTCYLPDSNEIHHGFKLIRTTHGTLAVLSTSI